MFVTLAESLINGIAVQVVAVFVYTHTMSVLAQRQLAAKGVLPVGMWHMVTATALKFAMNTTPIKIAEVPVIYLLPPMVVAIKLVVR